MDCSARPERRRELYRSRSRWRGARLHYLGVRTDGRHRRAVGRAGLGCQRPSRWYRRPRLPVTAQAGTEFDAVRARVRSVALGDGVADVVLTLVVLVAVAGAVGVVANESTSTGSVTEFYILGEDESGNLVAGSYPSNPTGGRGRRPSVSALETMPRYRLRPRYVVIRP
ncbi:MAG: DUF1616 domain-containing protein [Halobacteriales archaeon]|nr:DUF1616 domain-containing protein [Halobacteriales archaeon]